MAGVPTLDWMVDKPWVIWLAVLVIVVFHLLMGRKFPRTGNSRPTTVTRVWWTSYMVFTFLLTIVNTVCMLISRQRHGYVAKCRWLPVEDVVLTLEGTPDLHKRYLSGSRW